MKPAMLLTAAAVLLSSSGASAYEFPLQFIPTPGRVSHLVVAGYRFSGGQVVGDCSYDITTSGSGRDPRSYTTHYYYTCTWDNFGKYLHEITGAPTAPTPISSVGGVTIYAKVGVPGALSFHTTGADTNGGAHGFVTTPSAVYAWVTPSGGAPSTSDTTTTDIPLTLTNLGDLPLKISSVIFGPTSGKLTVKSNTCRTSGVLPGANCVITVAYDPTVIPPGDDPYLLYDHISVTLKSNAPTAPVFTETLEVPIPAG